MSWITRWKIRDLHKWGGWHSLEDRENYLLSEIERLENEVNILKTKDKLLDEKLGKVKELALGAVIEYFQKNVIVQHYKNDYFVAEKRSSEVKNEKIKSR